MGPGKTYYLMLWGIRREAQKYREGLPWWLVARLPPPNARRAPGSILVRDLNPKCPQLRFTHTAAKTQHSEINKYFFL